MTYNFDEIIERRSTNSVKWNHYPEDVLPMWVADMDFRSPNAVINALRAKAEHGIFGYEMPPEALISAVCERMEQLYQWKVTPQQVIVLPGLVTGINVVSRALCQPGDGVLTNTPIYPPFLSAPKNHGLTLQTAPLAYRSSGRRFHYELDFDALEAAVTDHTRLFLLCHPHNPIGHSYGRDELTKIGEFCLQHNLVICSDEIHAELLLGGTQHTPLTTISPEIAAQTVTLIAPSKTFNIAGLGCAFAIVPNEDIRHKLISATEGMVPLVTGLGLAAGLAAFRNDPDCNEWLASLLTYLTANRDMLVKCIDEDMPGLKVTNPDSTYLAWIDCREAGLDMDPFEFFIQKAKIGFNDGFTFGENGQGFVRMNFACPRPQLIDALERMKNALRS